jgi:hypothetical protein
MSNFDKKIGTDRQRAIEFAPAPGSFDDDQLVRSLISAAIKLSGKKRELIADEMTSLVGRSISAAGLNSFSADSKEGHRWPLSWTRAFCTATGDWRLFGSLLERGGIRLITAEEVQLLELGRNYLKQKQAAEEVSRLESSLTRRKP